MSWLGRDDGLGPRALKVASGTTLAILMSHEKTIVPTVAVTLGAATLKALDRATVEIDHGATKKEIGERGASPGALGGGHRRDLIF